MTVYFDMGRKCFKSNISEIEIFPTSYDMVMNLYHHEYQLAPLFERYQRFSSVEAWDWFIRGCPDNEHRLFPGLLTGFGRETCEAARIGWDYK